MNYKNIYNNPKMIEVNGIVLEVFEAGQEHKKPIVLCHGWPQHAYTWRHQVTALVDEGYHVIIPNQRGYGNSSVPKKVTEYDIQCLSDDLVALLDYYQYDKAVFLGHDWGATVVWGLSQLYPNRVDKIINLSVPYLERGEKPWLTFLEDFFGPDHYMVHFNQKPGVADLVLESNTGQFLRNMYRKNEPIKEPQDGMAFINLARQSQADGDAIMSDDDLNVYINAFTTSGFTGSINWYRNLDRNWHILEKVDPIITHKALMIYGSKDPVLQSPTLSHNVPNVDIEIITCGHWIQEEKPIETNTIIIDWLRKWQK